MLDRLHADLGHRRIRLYFAGETGQVRDLLCATGITNVVLDTYPTVEASVTAARGDLARPPGTGHRPA